MVNRRVFTKEFKLEVLRELNDKTLAQLCREHQLQPALVNRWRREHRTNPRQAFSGKGKLYKEEAKLAKYECLLGQLYAENAFLKKALEKQQQMETRRGSPW